MAKVVTKIEKKQYDAQITSVNTLVYDQNWAEKQIYCFTEWINHVLSQSVNGDGVTMMARSVTETVNGLKSVMQRSKYESICQKSRVLYEDLSSSIGTMEEYVSSGNSMLREDRNILADLGLQEVLFNLIFAYGLPWILLGLNTVFGVVISIPPSFSEKNIQNDIKKKTVHDSSVSCMGSSFVVWRQVIKSFLLNRLLNNPDAVLNANQQVLLISEEMTTKERQQLLSKKIDDEKKKYFMKKFFSFVLFLDAARKNRILGLSALFTRESGVRYYLVCVLLYMLYSS
jgi:hypothetical protein